MILLVATHTRFDITFLYSVLFLAQSSPLSATWNVALPSFFFTPIPLFKAGTMLSGDIFVLTQKNSNSENLSKLKLYLTAQIAFGFVDKDRKMNV